MVGLAVIHVRREADADPLEGPGGVVGPVDRDGDHDVLVHYRAVPGEHRARPDRGHDVRALVEGVHVDDGAQGRHRGGLPGVEERDVPDDGLRVADVEELRLHREDEAPRREAGDLEAHQLRGLVAIVDGHDRAGRDAQRPPARGSAPRLRELAGGLVRDVPGPVVRRLQARLPAVEDRRVGLVVVQLHLKDRPRARHAVGRPYYDYEYDCYYHYD